MSLQRTATHCNTLQRTATYCNTRPIARRLDGRRYLRCNAYCNTHCNTMHIDRGVLLCVLQSHNAHTRHNAHKRMHIEDTMHIKEFSPMEVEESRINHRLSGGGSGSTQTVNAEPSMCIVCFLPQTKSTLLCALSFMCIVLQVDSGAGL